ncbi:paraquat-inducible protein A [Defluviimonas aestuarii]|jgi:paraquat-inducible protein A|uniref:paraquat-inducible protein A n=1 Tax=Albidovulum aestuarii TaxID=1130726 RepID=UPI00249CB740|nr:paraquat-inducible protein A [Defluviimonas aestuarii]MDI3335422.1 paraquat-inducible protein A [Defluviimonas aestuarii]
MPEKGPAPAGLDGLIACPTCDALHNIAPVPPGSKARCHRCHTVLMTPRQGAMTRIVMLAATAAVLMIAAIFFPFLELQVGGLSRKSSVFDAITAFSASGMLPLSIAVAALIVVLPFARLVAIAYALGPMALGWHPAPQAARAFRWAEATRPWAMAEIFIVGVAVALVKITGLAKVTPGPAFWAFAALVLVTVLKDSFMCRLTVWKTLEERSRS